MSKKMEFPADPKVKRIPATKNPAYRRQEKPEKIIKNAVHNRDLEDLLWGLIALSCKQDN